MTHKSQAPEGGEALYLVHAGGDGYQAEIVPESKLDDAFLLTQWGSLGDLDAEEREDALHHFHDDDAWTHKDVTGKGDRLKFSLALEDGWIEVVRLPAIPHAEDVARLESQNRAVAELIIRNDKAGAVKWAQGLAASLDEVEVRVAVQAPAERDDLATAAAALVLAVQRDWPGAPSHRAAVLAAAGRVQQALDTNVQPKGMPAAGTKGEAFQRFDPGTPSFWLRAALDCASFEWDPEQREMAEEALAAQAPAPAPKLGGCIACEMRDAAIGQPPSQDVTPEFLSWLESKSRSAGVAANEAWNAGVAWARSQGAAVGATQAAPTYLSDAWLYRYAQEAAFALNRQHSYTPKTAAAAKDWMPHWWVCEAIQSAWLDGQAGKPKARCPQLGDAPEIEPPVQGSQS